MTLIIGLPGRTGNDLTKMERHSLEERMHKHGGFETISLPPIPTKARDVTYFVEEAREKNCWALLLEKKPFVETEAPEHIFGLIRINNIHVLRFVGQLEMLSSFSENQGVFTFCGPDEDKLLFPDMKTLV